MPPFEHQPALIIADGGLPALLAMWMEGVVRRPPPAARPPMRPARSAAIEGGGGAGVVVGGADEESLRLAPHLVFRPAGLSPPAWEAVERAAEICQLGRVINGSAGGEAELAVGLEPPETAAGLAESRLLLDACEEAVRQGLTRIIWPVQLGPGRLGQSADPDRVRAIARAADRALLASRLAALDAPASAAGLRIETPWLDLTDDQIADLAADADAPVSAAWWCVGAGGGGAGGEAAEGMGGATSEECTACGRCAACRRWGGALGAVGLLAAATAETSFASEPR
ncbi:MAG: 7-cyano-7-deazaguanine synthase [Phycisphaeraceae bacterium]|nr:7-cyano-7-deazaguanine synthase [Phycisphaeraceae bacterium]